MNQTESTSNDLDYDNWFVCDLKAEPTRRARRIRADPLATIKQSLREIVREELERDRHRKSFAAASGMLSLTELCEFLGKGRNTVYECRRQRDRAKTAGAKSLAFPPEYGDGRSPRWKRSEVEAWVNSQKRGA